MIFERTDFETLQKKIDRSPAVVILGPRQVGKTTLALQVAKKRDSSSLYLDLESPRDLAKFGEDAETFLKYHQNKLIILDEIQSQPYLFPIIRSLIDKNRKNGRFILLGSATPELVKGVSESLTGRLSYLDLNPLKQQEILVHFPMKYHWFRGGFPLAMLAENDNQFLEWMEGFIRSYIQSDLTILFGYHLTPAITGKLWTMLANNHGQLLNAQDYARSVGVTSPVIKRYIDILEGAFLIYKLRPWFNNASKRLIKSHKVYIKDSGILHALLGINNFDELTYNKIIGLSWEGYVIQQIQYHKSPNINMYFYRTHTGTEIDLLLVKTEKPVASIEIKFNNAPKPSKGFFVGIEDLCTVNNFIITPSSDTYPYRNVIVCNLIDFINNYLPNL
ncbi:MAG: ATP-binding protein [Prolixibacteraceae bacterium]|nr:ATP-binding protein [Prolixibacteraceae bacterium]